MAQQFSSEKEGGKRRKKKRTCATPMGHCPTWAQNKQGFVGLRAKKAFNEAKRRIPMYYEFPMRMWY